MQEAINRILDKYLIEKRKEFAQNRLAHFIRSDVSGIVQAMVDSEYPGKFKVSASPGQGQWAEIPWIGIFDKDITESPRHGYFVMYIFTADMSAVYLSLNQGWLFFKDTFGAEAKEKIATAAEAYRRILRVDENYDYDTITLRADGELGIGYELGHVYGKKYEKGMVPGDEALKRDLLGMIALYQRLMEIIGTESPEQKIKEIISEHEASSEVTAASFMDEAKRPAQSVVPEIVRSDNQSVEVNFLTLQEVSEKSAVPTEKTRKYLDELERAGICSSSIVEGERLFPLNCPELVSRLDTLSYEKPTLEDAIKVIKEGDEMDLKKLKDLEEKVDKLSKSMDSLSSQFSSHVAKYHSTTEKKGFCYHFKEAFRSIGKKKS
ncbi:MAG: DUF3578 domain-containing protein [Kosmotogaceae bacterium]|nr:DUF3578 domain-containing protein [Kosmotogaceae bacterium]